MTVGVSRCVFVAMVVVMGMPAPAVAQRAFFLVRHAEKVDDSRDPDLTNAGRTRAASLGRLLRDSGVTTIYSSDFQRTRKTAQPLADALGLQVVVTPREPVQVLRRLRTHRRNDTVLVVAHSDTLPDILRGLGHREAITIADLEYDNLFVVFPRAGAPPTVLRLRY